MNIFEYILPNEIASSWSAICAVSGCTFVQRLKCKLKMYSNQHLMLKTNPTTAAEASLISFTKMYRYERSFLITWPIVVVHKIGVRMCRYLTHSVNEMNWKICSCLKNKRKWDVQAATQQKKNPIFHISNDCIA